MRTLGLASLCVIVLCVTMASGEQNHHGSRSDDSQGHHQHQPKRVRGLMVRRLLHDRRHQSQGHSAAGSHKTGGVLSEMKSVVDIDTFADAELGVTLNAATGMGTLPPLFTSNKDKSVVQSQYDAFIKPFAWGTDKYSALSDVLLKAYAAKYDNGDTKNYPKQIPKAPECDSKSNAPDNTGKFCIRELKKAIKTDLKASAGENDPRIGRPLSVKFRAEFTDSADGSDGGGTVKPFIAGLIKADNYGTCLKDAAIASGHIINHKLGGGDWYVDINPDNFFPQDLNHNCRFSAWTDAEFLIKDLSEHCKLYIAASSKDKSAKPCVVEGEIRFQYVDDTSSSGAAVFEKTPIKPKDKTTEVKVREQPWSNPSGNSYLPEGGVYIVRATAQAWNQYYIKILQKHLTKEVKSDIVAPDPKDKTGKVDAVKYLVANTNSNTKTKFEKFIKDGKAEETKVDDACTVDGDDDGTRMDKSTSTEEVKVQSEKVKKGPSYPSGGSSDPAKNKKKGGKKYRPERYYSLLNFAIAASNYQKFGGLSKLKPENIFTDVLVVNPWWNREHGRMKDATHKTWALKVSELKGTQWEELTGLKAIPSTDLAAYADWPVMYYWAEKHLDTSDFMKAISS